MLGIEFENSPHVMRIIADKKMSYQQKNNDNLPTMRKIRGKLINFVSCKKLSLLPHPEE